MSLHSLQSFRFGLKKEAVRGTAEASPTKWYPVLEPEVAYGPVLLQDAALRGIRAEFAPVAGRKLGTGKFKMILDAQTIGELLYSLMGGVASVQQGVTTAYQHSFTLGTSIQPPSYTFFMDYGLAVKKYNRCVVKSLTFNGPVDGLITVDVDFLFESEASGSIGSPSFPTQKYLSFQHAQFKRAGSTDTDIKNWSMKIDSGAKALQTLAQAQDIQDIITPDPMQVSGDFVALFQSETERNKFLANTSVALRALIEGDVADTPHKFTVDLPLTDCRYKAYPFAWEDNLLAAKVEYQGYHNGTSQILPVIINTDVSY